MLDIFQIRVGSRGDNPNYDPKDLYISPSFARYQSSTQLKLRLLFIYLFLYLIIKKKYKNTKIQNKVKKKREKETFVWFWRTILPKSEFAYPLLFLSQTLEQTNSNSILLPRRPPTRRRASTTTVAAAPRFYFNYLIISSTSEIHHQLRFFPPLNFGDFVVFLLTSEMMGLKLIHSPPSNFWLPPRWNLVIRLYRLFCSRLLNLLLNYARPTI